MSLLLLTEFLEPRIIAQRIPVGIEAKKTVELITQLASICAWTGEKDLALEQLAVSAPAPFGVHYGDLKPDPVWDPLRGDLRFEKIVTLLAPKEIVSK